MKRSTAALLVLLAFGGLAHAASKVTVSVIDEHNVGILSRILLIQQGMALGDTDATGHFERAYKCQTGDYLKARPADIGSYFESAEMACASNLTLRVISKQTPQGTASSVKIEQIRFSNGMLGFVVLKGRIDTYLEGNRGGGCDAQLSAGVYAQAFVADENQWALAGSKEGSLSQALAAPMNDQATESLESCETNNPELALFKNNFESAMTEALISSKVDQAFASELVQGTPEQK